jgi:predicted phosphodiesterase
MKFILISDLHVDIGHLSVDWEKYASQADTIVVAGDTANSVGEAAKTLNKLAKKFKTVISTDGNHEHYANRNQKRSLDDSVKLLNNLTDDNVHMLSHLNPMVEVDGQTFFGCNGWYSLNAVCEVQEGRNRWLNGLNDNLWIGMLEFNDGMYPDTFAARDAWFINDAIEKWKVTASDSKAVVVLHTPPIREAILWKPENPSWNFLNGCYCNLGMGEVIEKHADVISNVNYGHTHTPFDFDKFGIRFTCNPNGYRSENSNWEPVVIEI